MKILHYSHFIISALMILSGCQRGVDVSPPDSIVTIDPTASYDVKNNTLKTVNADTYHPVDNITIDINQDGEADLKISSYYSHGISGYSNNSSEISALDMSTSILSIEKKDTTCIYIMADSRPQKITENYDHSKTYNSSLQLSIATNYYPTINSLSDKLGIDNTIWKNSSLLLAYHEDDYPISNFNSDTVYSTKIYRGPWNNIDHKFIAARYISDGTTYLGWVEIGLSGYSQVTLYQYAFKKIVQ